MLSPFLYAVFIICKSKENEQFIFLRSSGLWDALLSEMLGWHKALHTKATAGDTIFVWAKNVSKQLLQQEQSFLNKTQDRLLT